MKPTIKIYGYGWVGKAMKELFPEAWIHDPAEGFVETRRADVAFIAVPTPLRTIKPAKPKTFHYGRLQEQDGPLDTSIVDSVIDEARESLLICRSTVNPGFCDRWVEKGKNLVFQPEYLGESVAHPLMKMAERQFMILGGRREHVRQAIDVYQGVYNANVRIRQCSALEAEVIKLSENRAIAFKVAQCQELYDACNAAGVDYNTVREAVYGDDPRFNLFWTFVYPLERGFKSKCIPKDVYAWAAWAESVGHTPRLTDAMLRENERLLQTRLDGVA